MITLQADFFSSNQSHYREIATQTEAISLAPANSNRRGGLILNLSNNDLYMWFGSVPPGDYTHWLIVPSRANCDIPFFFVGDIQGKWMANDNKNAKIYEFYGA